MQCEERKPWLPDEDQFLVDSYPTLTARAQADCLGRNYSTIISRRMKLRAEGRVNGRRAYHPPWSSEEVDILHNRFGRVKLSTLCRQLRRSPVGVRLKAKRLHVNMLGNFYSARMVADLLGVGCSKTVIAWLEKGWLTGRRSPVRLGPYQVWQFEEQDVVDCLRKYPWLAHRERMPEHYFRSIVREEWRTDPWYTLNEACRLLRCATKTLVAEIRAGRVRAIKSNVDKRWRRWWIRSSELDNFREELRTRHRRLMSEARLRARRNHRRYVNSRSAPYIE